MKRLAIALAGATALSLGAGAAAAQGWMPIVERQHMIEDRIEAGLLAGEITSDEALMLRADLDSLVALEGQYRRWGLSSRERIDLDRRFAALHDRVRFEMADADTRVDRLARLDDRIERFERRIEQGLRSGQLTEAEADDLRADIDAVARIEARYRIDGLSRTELADLDERFDELADRIGLERRDRERDYGWSRW